MISNVAFKVSLFQLSAMYVSIHFTCLFSLFNYSHRKYHLQTAVFSLLCTLKERPKERIFINIFYTILFCVFTLKQSSGGEVGDWRESIWYLHTWSIMGARWPALSSCKVWRPQGHNFTRAWVSRKPTYRPNCPFSSHFAKKPLQTVVLPTLGSEAKSWLRLSEIFWTGKGAAPERDQTDV